MSKLSMISNVMKARSLQKKTGISPYQNAEMAYQHKIPYWIPNNQGIIEQPGVSDDAKREECRRNTANLAPGGSFVSFPHVGDQTCLPLLIEEYFKNDVPFYKKHKMGPWNR